MSMQSSLETASSNSDDFDFSSIPSNWKKVMRDAGVRKKDLRDEETRRMVCSLK